MPRQLTISDIITSALDKDYSMDQAAADLGELMTEREQIMRRYGIDSPRLTELQTIITIQKKLAMGKLRGEQIFEQLAQLDKVFGFRAQGEKA